MSRPCGRNSYTDVSSIGHDTKQNGIYNIVLGASCVEECDWTGDMEDLKTHQETCEFIDIECDRCEQDVKRKDMDKHLAQECPEQEAPCPKQCGKSLKRKELGNHVKLCGERKSLAELHSVVRNFGTKQGEQQQSSNQLKQLVQAQQTKVTDGIVAFVQNSQQQLKQTLSQLQENFRAQQAICSRNHQEHDQRVDDMKQCIARLEADLKKRQKDQQACSSQGTAKCPL